MRNLPATNKRLLFRRPCHHICMPSYYVAWRAHKAHCRAATRSTQHSWHSAITKTIRLELALLETERIRVYIRMTFGHSKSNDQPALNSRQLQTCRGLGSRSFPFENTPNTDVSRSDFPFVSLLGFHLEARDPIWGDDSWHGLYRVLLAEVFRYFPKL